ncbi:MAG: response regulator [Patescibacteria group bacterium]
MKLLIVEDDTFFQKFYSNKLKEAGYEVEVACDGNEGLEKIISTKPDLILLDLIMPNKDGFEVLETVAKNPVMKKIPIIVFSTLGDESDVKRTMGLGVVDYINKSFHDIENLKKKINAHLSPQSVAAPTQTSAPIVQPPAAQPAAQSIQPVQTIPIQPLHQPTQPSQPIQPVQPVQPTQQPATQPVTAPAQTPPSTNGNTSG